MVLSHVSTLVYDNYFFLEALWKNFNNTCELTALGKFPPQNIKLIHCHLWTQFLICMSRQTQSIKESLASIKSWLFIPATFFLLSKKKKLTRSLENECGTWIFAKLYILSILYTEMELLTVQPHWPPFEIDFFSLHTLWEQIY